MEILVSPKSFIMGRKFFQFSSSSSSSSFSFCTSGVCRFYGRTKFIVLLNFLFSYLFFFLFSSFFSLTISFSELLDVVDAITISSSSKHQSISEHQYYSPSVAHTDTKSTTENIEVKQRLSEMPAPPPFPPPPPSSSSNKDGESDLPNNDTMVINPSDMLSHIIKPIPADANPSPRHLPVYMPGPTEDLDRVAYHEAGHAVAAYYLRKNVEDVKGVNIVSTGAAEGFMEQEKPTGYPTIENLRSRLPILFAGSEAEKLKFHRDGNGDAMDFHMAENLANQLSIFEEQKKYTEMNTTSIPEALLMARRQLELREAQKKAMNILRHHQGALERVSQMLLKNSHISGLELQQLIEEKSGMKSKEIATSQKSSSPNN